jgi:hypothetical protein
MRALKRDFSERKGPLREVPESNFSLKNLAKLPLSVTSVWLNNGLPKRHY